MKRSRVRRQSPKARVWKELDALARHLVVVLRDRNTCQRCGNRWPVKQIQWAHILNRQAKSIQWTPWASLALCSGCHMWFDADRTRGRAWWAEKFPERAQRLAIWRATRSRPVSLGMEREWLRQEIERYQGGTGHVGPTGR